MAKRNIQRVVIVGCGIAGPALGMFLRRIGIEVVLCERRPGTAVDEGLFLGVAPNGMNVLADIGVHQSLKRSARPVVASSFRMPGGR